MRISDWSSDVCSSDLGLVPASNPPRAVALEARWTPEPSPGRRGEVWRWPHSGLKQRALHRLAADRAAAVAPGEFLFGGVADVGVAIVGEALEDRKSTRLNSSH